jgi:hypothetical protein
MRIRARLARAVSTTGRARIVRTVGPVSECRNLTAISAQTGETITTFGHNGRVDLRVALWREARNPLQTSNPGRIFENLFIISLPAQGAGYDSTPCRRAGLRRRHRQDRVGLPQHSASG